MSVSFVALPMICETLLGRRDLLLAPVWGAHKRVREQSSRSSTALVWRSLACVPGQGLRNRLDVLAPVPLAAWGLNVVAEEIIGRPLL